MKKLFIIVISAIITGILSYGSYQFFEDLLFGNSSVAPVSEEEIVKEKPLDKYGILSLSKRAPSGGEIILDEAVATTSAYTKYHFHFPSNGKKVTGMAHIPTDAVSQITPTSLISPTTPTATYPVIIQFRGYVPREMFTTGEGTKRSGEVYASNGFVTLAPDFLGYGGSDMPENNVFEERFETYTVALDLLSSLSSLPFVDTGRVGIWGHSNGGHIALTVLEATERPIPTTLWAPVTKPFPYSILYYTDEAPDFGKLLRRELATFEKDYDVDLYTLRTYIDRLNAPIQLHQGTADDAVPEKWSQEFVDLLEEKEKDITYYTYPGADHNMLGPPAGGWNTVVERDIAFFKNALK